MDHLSTHDLVSWSLEGRRGNLEYTTGVVRARFGEGTARRIYAHFLVESPTFWCITCILTPPTEKILKFREDDVMQPSTVSITAVAEAFFDACETGKGWEICSSFCTPDATFSAQAEPLLEVKTLAQYTDWMKGMLTLLSDARYE